MQDFSAHYLASGVMPGHLVLSNSAPLGSTSIHAALGSAPFLIGLLFALHLLAALFFSMGFHTKIAHVVLWFLYASLHTQAPAIVNNGDIIFRQLLFWSLFLPLNQYYSVDAKRRQFTSNAQQYLGFASAALLLQMAYIYFFTGMLKSASAWHVTYDALTQALRNREYATPLGNYFAQFEGPNKVITVISYWLEILTPVGLFFPWKTRLIRTITTVALIALHFGIELLFQIGFFGYVCWAGLILFLPVSLIDRFPLLRHRAGTTLAYGKEHVGVRWLCGILLLIVTLWNFDTIGYPGLKPVLKPVKRVVHFLRLDQRWTMFAPAPADRSGFLVAEGLTEMGESVNLFTGHTFSWANLEEFPVYYDGWRWRDYIFRIRWAHLAYLRPILPEYLTREYNRQAAEENAPKVTSATVYVVYRTNLSNDETLTSEVLATMPPEQSASSH